jgi:hypothetical protein
MKDVSPHVYVDIVITFRSSFAAATARLSQLNKRVYQGHGRPWFRPSPFARDSHSPAGVSVSTERVTPALRQAVAKRDRNAVKSIPSCRTDTSTLCNKRTVSCNVDSVLELHTYICHTY